MARRFGLEVEFGGDMGRLIETLRAENIPVRDLRHSHLGNDPMAWTVKYDGSVSRGGELVSPPLDFDDPEQRGQVDRAVRCLQIANCTTDPNAGIHVHIEAVHENGTNMTGKEIAAVVRMTYKFEDAMYRIASSGWRTIRPGARTYAKPIPEDVARAIMACRTMDEVRNVWNGQSPDGNRITSRSRYRRVSPRVSRSLERYTATNLRALDAHNTIEFRYFNSSINAVRIQTYIALCMAIVQDARNGYSRSVTKSYRVGYMATNGEKAEKAVLLRLQQILRTNSRDTKVCMSKEDWKNLRNIVWAGSRPQANIWNGGF